MTLWLIVLCIPPVVAFVLLWFYIGNMMLDLTDETICRDLFKWAKRYPFPLLYQIAVMCWPYMLFRWKKQPNGELPPN